MRLLTILAVAAVAAGIYHYRSRRAAPPAKVRPFVSDDELAQRVQAAIGAAVANPGRVEVRVIHGIVQLRGQVRQVERDLVVKAALGVPEARQVTDLLETEEPVGEISTLQAGIATEA